MFLHFFQCFLQSLLKCTKDQNIFRYNYKLALSLMIWPNIVCRYVWKRELMANRVGLLIFQILKETKWLGWIFEPECCWVKINVFFIKSYSRNSFHRGWPCSKGLLGSYRVKIEPLGPNCSTIVLCIKYLIAIQHISAVQLIYLLDNDLSSG